MNKEILFIHYHYPPMRSSGIYRNYHMSTSLTKVLGKSLLITTDNSKVLANEPLPVHPDMTIHTIFTPDYRRFISWLKPKNKVSNHYAEKRKTNALMSLLIRIQRSFPFSIFIAEGGPVYIIAGYLKAKKLIRENNIKIIYSSFMPYADHLIAALLKKTFPSLVWVADFRDLLTEPIYQNTVWPGLQRWFESRILSGSNLITTVSEGLSRKMTFTGRPVITLTKGVDIREPVEQYKKFSIGYSGSLFLHFRDPRPLYRELRELFKSGDIQAEDVEFLYAGKDGPTMQTWAEEEGVGPIFRNLGYLSRDEALVIQSRSHINLLLTSASPEHYGLLTGKLFEYFEAGNPILCLVRGTHDPEIELIFNELHAGLVAYDSVENGNMREFLLDKYREWKTSGKVAPVIDRELLQKQYSWEGQARKLIEALYPADGK